MKNEILRKKYKTVGHARHTDKIGAFTPKGVIGCSFIGVAVSVIFIILLGFITAAILYKTADPARYVTPTALSVLYVSVFLGGVFASRICKKSSLLCGLVSGTLILIIMLLVSLSIGGGLSSDYGILGGLLLRALVIAASITGAIIGTVEPGKKSKKRKNYKKR